ncbi:carboxylesterase family protein [Actinomycetospora lemnae]|uniref:Carboxylic ester hydrolase n=1 Tax=Actinomycetospora lemnae TaxID=3019891 RepID=A0ABT5SQY7_9PSEU|nr:carboxylesterase family protein [Actinomycetospora sp. DW7H6]MDD7965264.1 carboxylesterase family protein [Actinomycetospora sp. DW7H6]
MELATSAGRVRGLDRDGLGVFLGLPYAEAPVGPRRFAAPVPVTGWDGVRDATAFGPAVPQGPPAPGAPSPWHPADGLGPLTLNVFTPDPGGSGLPVVVWFHGGAWVRGSPRMPLHDGGALAAAGAVVVTVGFRLGAEGFASLPGAPEDRGLLDQVAALTWVHEHVASFGGDPGCVTVAGQSGGAASVAVLLAAPTTEGLLHRAVAQSVHGGFRTRDEAAGVTARLAAALGVAPTVSGFDLPPERIVDAQDAPLRGPADGVSAFGPVVDGDLVVGQPWEGLAQRPRPDVPLLVTWMREEARSFPLPPAGTDPADVATAFGLECAAGDAYRALAGDVEEAVVLLISDALHRLPARRTARAHAGPVWTAELAWRSPRLGACHGLDVPLLLGTTDTRPAARMLGAPPPAAAGALGAELRRAWVAFATTGDPGWPRYGAGGTTRRWDPDPTDVPDPLAASAAIWGDPGS